MFGRASGRLRALRERTSLGGQVALFSGGACLLVAIVASLLSAQVAQRQAAEQAKTEMTGLAGNLADRLDYRMFERLREVRNVAEFGPLKGIWTGPPEVIRTVLEQLQSTLPEYAWIGFAGTDGTVVAATRGMLEGGSVAQRPWFVEGLRGPTVQDVHDAKLLAQKLGQSVSGDPFRFVDAAVPVRDARGALVGVLGAHMSWTWAAEVRRTALANIDPEQATDIWILSESGGVLLGRPEFGSSPFPAARIADVKRGRQAAFVDESATPALTAAIVTKGHGDYPGLGWIVVARRPLSVALAPARELAVAIVGVGLGLAALIAAAAAALGLRLTRPLHNLAASLDLIGRDPSVTMAGRGYGSSDVIRLSSSVRSLLRRIGMAEIEGQAAKLESAEIAARLEERTKRYGEDLNTLQTLADQDPLTGLLNRRAFHVFAVDAMSYFRRYKRPIAVLVIDIDHFKRVNDTFGHAVGDDAIVAVGQMLSSAVRGTDKVARFGGEEFVILLRETSLQGALIFSERMREAIAKEPVAIARGGPLHVTVSIGLTLAGVQDRDVSDMIERADRALYAAKSGGRNRVVTLEALEEFDRAA